MENKEIQEYKKRERLINIIDNGYNLILENTLFYTLKDNNKNKKYKKMALLLHGVILKNYSILKKRYNVDYMLYKLLNYVFE